jgi:branched-chain amino acid transport system permease protein
MTFAEAFAQHFANGIVTGAGYVLVAIGLTMVFGIMGIINFAQGEFYMFGAFITIVFMTAMGMNYFVAILLAMGVTALFGALAQTLTVRPLQGRHEMTIMLSTIGLSTIMMEAARLIWGAAPRSIPSPYETAVITMGSIRLTEQRIIIVAATALLVAIVWLILQRTKIGKMMRAAAQNETGAALCGINLQFIHYFTFAVSVALAAAGGALLGTISFAFPNLGAYIVLKGFVVVILGGLASVPGAILGGMILGIVESLGAGFISVDYKDAISYGALVVLLLFRPWGLFGQAK